MPIIHSTGLITINGQPIEVSVQMDNKPLGSSGFTADAFARFMQEARKEIVLAFGVPPSMVGVQGAGQFAPTGPVVEGSIEPEQEE
jgi:hypothetical protein